MLMDSAMCNKVFKTASPSRGAGPSNLPALRNAPSLRPNMGNQSASSQFPMLGNQVEATMLGNAAGDPSRGGMLELRDAGLAASNDRGTLAQGVDSRSNDRGRPAAIMDDTVT